VTVEIRLTQWGMGMQAGTIVEWLKHPGDAVTEGEPIVDVETDKVTAQVVAPASGVLGEIRVPAGMTVPVRAVLGTIEQRG
jgi:pyruvate/2-oxoglutarate dehydrogenase complex dihydrolipoamide acyltransferase (E2) component